MVAEIDVNQNTGAIAVTRLVISQDCGPISNPDGLRNQMGRGRAPRDEPRALVEEVTWDGQKITSVDWRTYRSLPVGFKVPKIETVLINRMDDPATGAGRDQHHDGGGGDRNGAVFDATGVRLQRVRQVPIHPNSGFERVRFASEADEQPVGWGPTKSARGSRALGARRGVPRFHTISGFSRR